jgi:serine/threonine protein kinase
MTPALDLAPTRAPAASAPGRALPTASRLRDYETTAVLHEGPTSIVYLAWDHSLQRKVAIKEYLPAALVSRLAGAPAVTVRSERQLDAFEAGLKGFLGESRVLARFDHPSLLKVYRFWEENGTAYMAMPHHEGPTLAAALAELGHVPSESELRTWLKPVLNALAVLHDGGVWHQNIAPDEIVLTPIGPVLLGFASAAHAIEAAQYAPAAALKPGFAAIEQYGSVAGTTRGPWTDLYALASVLYAAITGSAPAPAADRLVGDPVLPLSIIAAGLYDDAFLAAIDAAMRVQPESRPRDHLDFRRLMGDIEAPGAPVSLAPRRDLMQEPFVGVLADDREVTVPDRPLLALAEPTRPPMPAASGSRPRPTVPAALRDSGSMPLPVERGAPSWIRSGRGEGAPGKRALYGVVAVTCFLVGAIALAVQFTLRQAPSAGAAASPSPAAPNAAARAMPLPAALTAPTAARPVFLPLRCRPWLRGRSSRSPQRAPRLRLRLRRCLPSCPWPRLRSA